MSDDLERWKDSEAPDPWERKKGEKAEAYSAFVTYCKMGTTRTLGRLAGELGITDSIVRTFSKKYGWVDRAAKYDLEVMKLSASKHPNDVGEARDAQIAAGNMLLELGLKAIQIKNPTLIPIDKALKIVQQGVDIQRKAYGEADININMTNTDISRVHNLLEELDIIDAEVVEDGS